MISTITEGLTKRTSSSQWSATHLLANALRHCKREWALIQCMLGRHLMIARIWSLPITLPFVLYNYSKISLIVLVNFKVLLNILKPMLLSTSRYWSNLLNPVNQDPLISSKYGTRPYYYPIISTTTDNVYSKFPLLWLPCQMSSN
jgi:hypothetical protein